MEGLTQIHYLLRLLLPEELKLLAQEYESIRERMRPGNQRTYLMTALVARAHTLAGTSEAGRVAETLFAVGTEGARIVGIALALVRRNVLTSRWRSRASATAGPLSSNITR